MSENIVLGFYVHLKTKDLYRVTTIGTDCTNDRDGTPVVVYTRCGLVFVRELEEFRTKFRKVHIGGLTETSLD